MYPLYGEQMQYLFGVSVFFVSPGNNMVIFDEFNVVENTHDQVTISKLNSYVVAKHVSFWTGVAAQNPRLHIATIEYLLNTGQSLTSISAALNGRSVHCADYSAMNTTIDGLSDSPSVRQHPLCVPVLNTTGFGLSWQK